MSADALFSPFRLGDLDLKNRIVMAPMGENYGGTDGICGERAQTYYAERAKGGTSLIIVGAAEAHDRVRERFGAATLAQLRRRRAEDRVAAAKRALREAQRDEKRDEGRAFE